MAFADDIVLLRPIASHLDCQILQEDIDKIHQEYMNLHLLLNPAKTSYILCTMAPNPAEIFLDRTPELNGEPIERRPFLKYLGVIIDQKLNFGMHAELQAAKAKRAIGALWRVLGRWTSKSHFQEIYSKKIMPLLCYALPVSCPTTRKHWEIMEKVHRFACRLATNNFTAQYSDLLHELHWKPLARLCVERQILLIFKYLDGTRFLPEGTLELAPPQARQLRRLGHHEREVSVDTTIFHSPNHRPPRRALLAHAPFYFSVQEWNFLP